MTIQAYILFKVGSGTEREVCKRICNYDEVLVTGIIYGEYDVIAKISVRDMQALEEFLSVKIRTVPSVLVTSTMIIAREYKGINQRIRKSEQKDLSLPRKKS